jgi:hypothetical protein
MPLFQGAYVRGILLTVGDNNPRKIGKRDEGDLAYLPAKLGQVNHHYSSEVLERRFIPVRYLLLSASVSVLPQSGHSTKA